MPFLKERVEKKVSFDPNILPSEMLALSRLPDSDEGTHITAGEAKNMVALMKHYDRYDRLRLLSQEQRAREFMALAEIRKMKVGVEEDARMDEITVVLANSGNWSAIMILGWFVFMGSCEIGSALREVARAIREKP